MDIWIPDCVYRFTPFLYLVFGVVLLSLDTDGFFISMVYVLAAAASISWWAIITFGRINSGVRRGISK